MVVRGNLSAVVAFSPPETRRTMLRIQCLIIIFIASFVWACSALGFGHPISVLVRSQLADEMSSTPQITSWSEMVGPSIRFGIDRDMELAVPEIGPGEYKMYNTSYYY